MHHPASTPTALAGSVPVTVNGESYQIEANSSVSALLARLNLPSDRVAVELNRTLIRKRDWQNTSVPPFAQVEIVEFVGGG